MKNKKTLVSVVSVFMALLMVFVNLSLPVGATSENLNGDSTVQAPVNPEDKIDSALKEKMATASPDEKIPVAIWYTDVDQEQIDTLTTKKVGYSQDDIAVDYEMPSTALLSDLKDGKEGADAEMQAYMERTEQQREKERKRTDDYIMTRREFSRAKYNEKSAKIIKDIAINEEDITFKSQYAPMIITEMTVSEIEKLQTSSSITGIYYETDEANSNETDVTELTTMEIIKQVVGYTELVTKLESLDSNYLPGANIKVGVSEKGGLVDVEDSELSDVDITFIGDIEYDPDAPTHMTGVVKVIAGETDGFLKGAKIYCSDRSYSSIELLITNGLNIISFSDGNVNSNWADHIVAQHGVSFVAAAGNTNTDACTPRGYIYSTARGFNVIAVGSYYMSDTRDDVTLDKNDDCVAASSAFDEDVINGIEKPDVIMPYIPPNGATSYATPILASFIAMMYQLKPSLAAYPQAVKAIVLASCHRKVNPSVDGEDVETIYQGITERQGAGAPDIWTMACIVSQGTYGVGTIDTESINDFVRFTYPNYDGANNMNVSITWLRDGCFVDSSGNQISNPNHATDTLQVSPAVDVDLTVYRNGTYIKDSTLSKSSTEMAYFAIDNTNFDYTIKISKESNYDQLVKYGYAFSTDASALLSDTSVGIYQIKNLETDTYLTLDPQTNEIKLQEYSGADTQKWILKRPNVYQIYSGYEDTAGMLNRGNLLSTNNYKAIVGPSTLNLTKIDWLTDSTYGINGAVRFYTYFGGTQCYLSYSGTNVTLSSQSASTDAVSWILEKLYYRIGDVNMDGIISQADSRSIGYYLADSVEYNNMQIFLADANGDGLVTIHDRTAIQEMYEENE